MKKNIQAGRKPTVRTGGQKQLKAGKKVSIFQYHYIFLVVGLIFGLRFVFVNPPWQTNDEDRHFYNAYALSEGYIAPKVENGKIGFPMPTALSETVRSFQGIPFREGSKISRQKLNSMKRQALNGDNISFCDNPSAGIFPFPYIPAAIFIKIGGVFEDTPLWLGWWGRIGSLIAYLGIIFFALRIMPHFKPLLMIIALSPMALYQGASVTYDTLNLAFLFLLFAYVIKLYYQESPITLKQAILFFTIALAHRCSKDGYFILYFTLFAISINKFISRKVYVLAFGLLLIASFLPSYLWNLYISSLHLPTGKFQVDYTFSTALNIKYHLQDPIAFVSLLFQNLFMQGKLWLSGTIGRFGYSYTLLPGWIIFIQLLAYIAVVMLEKPGKALSMNFRAVILGLGVLNFFALLAGGLLSLSPVGANMLFGMQGRYFTPILPFIFLGFFYFPLYTDQEKYLKWVVPVYCIIILIFTGNFLGSQFYTA